MQMVRLLIRRQPFMLALLLIAALAFKALVPQGYMLRGGDSEMTLSLMLCDPTDGSGKQIEIPLKKDTGTDQHKGDAASQPCAFAGISHAAMDRVDPILLAISMAFMALLGLILPLRLPALLAGQYRPPARAPPLS
ncbi:hypothetical protein ACFOWX_00770 [Sphingorhabdus arenilitoris]|uniref:DUF2946 domain-containing protein n=1 Tax=Sphingorhabdus arenilitoris TaxID=1490041 RepID=A0ABV8RDD6_9SPHN